MRSKRHQDLPGPASSAEILFGFYLDLFRILFGFYLHFLKIIWDFRSSIFGAYKNALKALCSHFFALI